MMHDDEVASDAELVRRLLADQFPAWARLPIEAVPINGTDHALFRIGDDLVARMPRIEWAAGQADHDNRWLPLLAPHLPLRIPTPVAVGEPGHGFPWRWSVVPWIEGTNPSAGNFEPDPTAVDLAAFIHALSAADHRGRRPARGLERGTPLSRRDAHTREAIEQCGNRVDGERVLAAWDDACVAPDWPADHVWVHGDLQPGNLIVRSGRLRGVIDFGCLGIGDPAVDLMPAWSLFSEPARSVFRMALGYDEDTWRRGRGWALSTAVIALPYYWETFPSFAAEAQRKIAAVVTDLARVSPPPKAGYRVSKSASG